MRRFFKKPMVVALAAVLVVGVVLGWRRFHNGSETSFRTVLVTRGDVAASISASGTIEPVEVVDIGAQVAGLIKSFGKDINGRTIDYGSIVEEGAVLATIDDSVYAADLSVAKAQLEQAKAAELSAAANLEQMQARLDQSAAEWKRAQELYTSKLMAQVDYDTDKANYEIAKANLSVAQAGVAEAKATIIQAQAGLEKAQRNLDFCIIKSPVKGVIIDRRVNIGQTVVSSLNAPSLFLIAEDLTKMQIWVAVNEADVGRIIPDTPVTFTCDAFPGRQFQGTVGKIRLNATMTQNVVMYTVEVNMDNSDKVLLPYLTANVRFVVHEESGALLVPSAALRWSPPSLAYIAPEARSPNPADPPSDNRGKKEKAASKEAMGTVWVKDGSFVRPLEVKLGTSDGANTAVVADDLREGQEVVVGAATGAPENTENPFLPPVRKR
jgi:HlyD family secretion protein